MDTHKPWTSKQIMDTQNHGFSQPNYGTTKSQAHNQIMDTQTNHGHAHKSRTHTQIMGTQNMDTHIHPSSRTQAQNFNTWTHTDTHTNHGSIYT